MNPTSLSKNPICRANCAANSVVALHLNGDSRADLAATTSSNREDATQASAAFPFHCSARMSSRCQNVIQRRWLLLEVAPLPSFQKIGTECAAQHNDKVNACQADVCTLVSYFSSGAALCGRPISSDESCRSAEVVALIGLLICADKLLQLLPVGIVGLLL